MSTKLSQRNAGSWLVGFENTRLKPLRILKSAGCARMHPKACLPGAVEASENQPFAHPAKLRRPRQRKLCVQGG